MIRQHLKSRENEVVYGLMRFSFDFVNESKISKKLFFVWYESSYFVHVQTLTIIQFPISPLRAPDTMEPVLRGKLKEYEGKMKKLLAPYTVSIQVNSLDTISNENWISAVCKPDEAKENIAADGTTSNLKEMVFAFEKALKLDQEQSMSPIEVMFEFCVSAEKFDEFQSVIERANQLPYDQQLLAIMQTPDTNDVQQQLIDTLCPVESESSDLSDGIARFKLISTIFQEQCTKLNVISPIQWVQEQVALSLMMYIATTMSTQSIKSDIVGLLCKFIHFLRIFCIEKKSDGLQLKDFWTDITGNGTNKNEFGERMIEIVCDFSEIDASSFSRITKLLPLWYHDTLRRFNLYHVVLANCSVEDIVALFMFKAEDDDDEKERNSDRENVDGVFCRFEKRGGDDVKSIMEVVEWKAKIVEWIRSEKVDGKQLMETDNEQLIKGMERALNIESNGNESLDRAFGVILDLCQQSAVVQILKNVKEQKVTRFDALKQYLVQQHDVDEKEIDILDKMVAEKGYESETLLLSEQWMASQNAPWNQLECAQFIPSFFRDRERYVLCISLSLSVD